MIENILTNLRRRPGIDVGLLDRGTAITVKTEHAIYDFTLVEPHLALVNVCSSEPWLRGPVLGKLIGSAYDLAGEFMLEEWIGQELYMHIQFRGQILISNPVMSASVKATDWHYDVF